MLYEDLIWDFEKKIWNGKQVFDTYSISKEELEKVYDYFNACFSFISRNDKMFVIDSEKSNGTNLNRLAYYVRREVEKIREIDKEDRYQYTTTLYRELEENKKCKGGLISYLK